MCFGFGGDFGIDEEEDRLTLGEGEVGGRLIGGVRHAADGADEDDVEFFD